MKSNPYTFKIAPLRRQLWGRYQEVADRAGVSLRTVQRVMACEYYNQAVLDAAIAIRDEAETLKQETLAKI